MLMDIKTYKNKVRGCWLGKNIGGTLGAPFECIRGVYDIEFYTQDLTEGALPNDDLDLQLVWLNAAEKYGAGVNSEILGEYWLTYIIADWSEYGAGKNNMRNGIRPPLSGWYNNHNKNSCGAFIRSEIWACLAPGHPEIAVKYALEDASVDHSKEGVYGEIFCAAIQSAAFCESDRMQLINIGLSYIPEDCGIAKAIKTVLNCYNSGMDWKQARKKVLQEVPCSFGMYNGYIDQEPETDVPMGEPGYDAPANVGIMVLGWMYGENDFGKSLCIAAGCCEDGDCTAATLGAILGIIHGADKLPEKWLKPIGDGIKTVSIDTTSGLSVPKTITELSRRVCALMPVFMGNFCDALADDGAKIILSEKDSLFNAPERFGVFSYLDFKERLDGEPMAMRMSNVLMDISVNFLNGINICQEQGVKLKIRIKNNIRRQQWLQFRWFLPENWEVSTGREISLNLDQPHGGFGLAEFEAVITPVETDNAKYDIVLEISSQGRLGKLYIPVTLINSAV